MRRFTPILMFNITPVIKQILPKVEAVFLHYNVNLDHLEYCLDWCVDESLRSVFLLSVNEKNKCDFYKTVYSIVSKDLDRYMRAIINFNDLNILTGSNVKTICNGQDLFLTTTGQY